MGSDESIAVGYVCIGNHTKNAELASDTASWQNHLGDIGGRLWVFSNSFVVKLVKTEKKDYTLETGIEYPKELHKHHNKLPLLAEIMNIRR